MSLVWLKKEIYRKNLHCRVLLEICGIFFSDFSFIDSDMYFYLQPVKNGVSKIKIHIWWQTGYFYFYVQNVRNNQSQFFMMFQNMYLALKNIVFRFHFFH